MLPHVEDALFCPIKPLAKGLHKRLLMSFTMVTLIKSLSRSRPVGQLCASWQKEIFIDFSYKFGTGILAVYSYGDKFIELLSPGSCFSFFNSFLTFFHVP